MFDRLPQVTGYAQSMWPVCAEPPPPLPDRSQHLDRHLGMICLCWLLNCCHNELPEDGFAFAAGHHTGHHADSGSPQSGYLYPWEPGDESWRDDLLPPGITPPRTPQR